MEQILLHLIGDYITQTEKMAVNKVKSFKWASLHAFIYTAPFLILTQSPLALSIMFFSHLMIDRFRLARFLIFAKNKITSPKLKWSECSATGFHKDMPSWMSVWLMIIIDNTMHLSINHLSISYL